MNSWSPRAIHRPFAILLPRAEPRGVSFPGHVRISAAHDRQGNDRRDGEEIPPGMEHLAGGGRFAAPKRPDLVTLASLVERETPRPEERPHVAGVFENRLRIGQPLQCDPTVVYALTLVGQYSGKLDGGDLHFSSAYNTYQNRGLAAGTDRQSGRSGPARGARSSAHRRPLFCR